MRVSAIRDFYALVSIDDIFTRLKNKSNGMLPKQSLSHSHAATKRLLKQLSDDMALCFRDYFFLASFAEARHARRRAAWSYADLPDTLNQVAGGNATKRDMAMEMALCYQPGDHNVHRLADLFQDNVWPAAYGGVLWSQCVEAVALYGKYDNIVYVDHCIDLQHNDGFAIDKTDASNHIDIDFDLYRADAVYFLDDKSASDVFIVDCARYLSEVAKDVKRLVRIVLYHALPRLYPDGYERRSWEEWQERVDECLHSWRDITLPTYSPVLSWGNLTIPDERVEGHYDCTCPLCCDACAGAGCSCCEPVPVVEEEPPPSTTAKQYDKYLYLVNELLGYTQPQFLGRIGVNSV